MQAHPTQPVASLRTTHCVKRCLKPRANTQASKPLNKQSGLSLIEVLIALLILSIGLLGIAGLQGTSLSKTREASLRTNAMILAQDLIDSMRSNPSAIAEYEIDSTQVPNQPIDCYTVTCDPTQLASFQLDNWWQQIDKDGTDNRFPEGKVSVDVTPRNDGRSNLVEIAISWNEIKDGVTETVTFRLNSLLPANFN